MINKQIATSFTDNELGVVVVKRNSRAKRCIARHKSEQIELTVPQHYTDNLVFEVFSKLKPQLLKLSKPKKYYFSPQTNFQTFTFDVNITTQNIQNYYVTMDESILTIVCPISIDFAQISTQNIIRNYIEKSMKVEAKRVLPLKVQYWANYCNFKYGVVKINSSKTRWGSCSSKGNINLSYSCMLLPEHLIDFIILHELCHTVEMNHGSHFWSLLDSVTDNRAKELTQELKNFTTVW